MLRILFIACFLIKVLVMHAQFQEYSSILGVSVTNPYSDEGNGVSFADFDLDGWDDISLVRKNLDPLFFMNTQNGFELVDLNVNNDLAINQKGILWADYDNDGDRDLLVTQKYFPVKLYRNDGDIFTMQDVAEESGLVPENVWHSGASWVDYDRDGYLDLYLCKYYTAAETPSYALQNHLYRNMGDGTFEDVTLIAGVGDGYKPSYQSLFFDFNNDHWPDLYVINDRVQIANTLYINNGDGTFSDFSNQSGTNIYVDAMCCSAADYDHDGDLDIFITNSGPDVLLLNSGNNNFTNYTAAGVNSEAHGWGGLWIDHGNNTWQDLFVCNQDTDPNNSLWPNNFYLNEGDGTFIHYENEAGLGNDNDASFSVARSDYNRDGWEDFITHNADESASSLWQNQSWQNSNHHWIQIKLEGIISNKDAVGTWLHVYLPNDVLVRYTTCGDNYLSQNSFIEHVGLAEHLMVDSLKITWPSGLQEIYTNLAADQQYEFIEGATLSASIGSISNDSLCMGDSIPLFITGFEEVVWSTNEVSDTIYADSTGWYYATAITSQGLPVQSDSIFLNFHELPTLTPQINHATCFGEANGSVNFVVTGGTPDYIIDFTNQANPDSLEAGVYSATCTDQLGCTTSIEFQILEPEPLTTTYQDTTVVDITGCGTYHEGVASAAGGSPPYNYSWEFNGPDQVFPLYFSDSTYTCVPNVANVSFILTVTDANNCTYTIADTLEVFTGIESLSYKSPHLFPNPFHNVLHLEGMGIQQIQLFNIRGERCFTAHTRPYQNKNTFHLPSLPSGIYICTILTHQTTHTVRLVHP